MLMRPTALLSCAIMLTSCAAAPAPDRTLVLELGPVLFDGQPGRYIASTALVPLELPHDAWLTSFEVELLGADGTLLPQALLHHVNVLLPGRRDLFRPIMQRLVAAGRETDAIHLPWPFAVRAHAGEQLLAFAMLHSEIYDPGPVTVRLNIGYRERGPARAVQPFFLDASPPPGPAGWDLPPGRSVRSWEGSPAVGGRVLALGGHLHRYGTHLTLEDVESGHIIARLDAEQNEDGSIARVPRRAWIWRGIELSPERTYRIRAYYDNPTDETIPRGAMGTLGGMIRPLGDWPEADPADDTYVRDLHVLGGADAAGHHH